MFIGIQKPHHSEKHRPQGEVKRDLSELLRFAYENDATLGNWLWYSPDAMCFLHAIGDCLAEIADSSESSESRKIRVMVALKCIAEDLYERPYLSADSAQLSGMEQDRVEFRARNVIRLWTGDDCSKSNAIPMDRDYQEISCQRLPATCRGDLPVSAINQPAFVLFFVYLGDFVQRAIPSRLF